MASLGPDPRWEYLLEGQIAAADAEEVERLRTFIKVTGPRRTDLARPIRVTYSAANQTQQWGSLSRSPWPPVQVAYVAAGSMSQRQPRFGDISLLEGSSRTF